MMRLKRKKMVLATLGMVFLLPLSLLLLIFFKVGPQLGFLYIVVWLLLNGLIGHISGRWGKLAIAILGPTALVAAGLLYTILTNPYGGLRSGPPGRYWEWWGLWLDIPMAISAFGMSFVMAARGIRIVEDHSRCNSCDYLLIGLAEPRCPECGTTLDPLQVGQCMDDVEAARKQEAEPGRVGRNP